jgi:sugar/nucleoside kinase (ribokinase family)
LSGGAFNKNIIEDLAWSFIQEGISGFGRGTFIVWVAEHGCLLMVSNKPPMWLPPYYSPGEVAASKIIDKTGDGNAFLGGFIMGYWERGDFVQAAYYGSVAASFLAEQVDTPKLEKAASPGERELWNGENPQERLELYQKCLAHCATK